MSEIAMIMLYSYLETHRICSIQLQNHLKRDPSFLKIWQFYTPQAKLAGTFRKIMICRDLGTDLSVLPIYLSKDATFRYRGYCQNRFCTIKMFPNENPKKWYLASSSQILINLSPYSLCHPKTYCRTRATLSKGSLYGHFYGHMERCHNDHL